VLSIVRAAILEDSERSSDPKAWIPESQLSTLIFTAPDTVATGAKRERLFVAKISW
jgi:hypothetical protein